MTKEIGSN